jgi:HEAT repeats
VSLTSQIVVREAIGLLGLGELEDPRTIDTMTNALGDRDANVRAMAAWALGQLEDTQGIALLGNRPTTVPTTGLARSCASRRPLGEPERARSHE